MLPLTVSRIPARFPFLHKLSLLLPILLLTTIALGSSSSLSPADASPAPNTNLEQPNTAQAHLAEPEFLFHTIAPLITTAASGDPFSLAWTFPESDYTFSVAWGDVDNDGDLDLAVGNRWQPNRLYRNDGGVLTSVWESNEADNTHSVAWGDCDGDGDLDLVVGNGDHYDINIGSYVNEPNRLYRNDGGMLTTSAVWSSVETDYTTSVAWGDYDGDGDPDLAVGNGGIPGGRNRIYRNDGGTLTSVWLSNEVDDTWSIAWGDVDNDGDLDLAVGNFDSDEEKPNRLYRNDGVVGGIPQMTLVWSANEVGDYTWSVAWGDVDNDGDLDLAVGNSVYQSNRLYRNDEGTLTTSAVWTSVETDSTRSVAWGDYDGDGDLDLAAGNSVDQPKRLYRNDGGTLTTSAVWSSPEGDQSFSVAWGDYDGDGDLDLAVGNAYQPSRLYRNNGEALTSSAVYSTTETDNTRSVAWGDYDGDGDLDLAVGNSFGTPNRLYRNDGIIGHHWLALAWSAVQTATTITSLAWGDYDGDGDLDLAVGNGSHYDNTCSCDVGEPNQIYRNGGAVGGAPQMTLAWSSVETDVTTSVAWGDYDGDGDLDLAVGNGCLPGISSPCYPNHLYRNEGGTLTTSAVWSSAEADATNSVAWGDYDGDGDLDLAVGNGCIGEFSYYHCYPGRLYRNDGGTLTISAVWSSATAKDTRSVAWGDYDSDGDLDLAVGNFGGPTLLYRNDNGALTANATWASVELDYTNSIAWGDYDGDGDLDLAVGNGEMGQPNRLYRNDSGTLTPRAAWSSAEADATSSVAWGDYDDDGDLDLAVGNGCQTRAPYTCYPNRVYLNVRDGRANPRSTPLVHVARPGPNADFYSAPRTWSGIVPITYTLSDPQGDPVKSVRAWYSPDGGGRWYTTAAASGTITANLATTATYQYKWDVPASGLFGQSDNVVFRIQAVPAITNTRNSVPGPYLYGAYSSQTFPFRVRGTQVRVLSGTTPISNAMVYRLPTGQTTAEPIADTTGRPFRTDNQGYLQGCGQLGIGDRLVALLPISATSSFTLYHTNATPITTGLSMYTVNAAGVQTLTVSSTNPLILFNLDVSLEWVARQDSAYLNQLEFNLHRASEVLYDITNGQAALGNITLYHDRQEWNNAHLRIYANNQLRPFADQGGIVTDPVTDPVTSTVVYIPGQVNMGATWNRYGDAGITLGEDWPRTLAHELGHYLLYLDDNYLGLDANGLLIPTSTCTQTIMSDSYRDDYSELRPSTNWLPACADTLSNKSTKRSDWTTVITFYPALKFMPDPGPSGLPLAVTQIKTVNPVTPTVALPDPRFYLALDGARVQPGGPAQAYVFRGDRLLNLGRPVVDQVLARGAQPDDRICVYELEANRLGCKTITANDNQQLSLYTVSNWQPDVRVSPVNSQTVNVRVLNLPNGLNLQARVFDDTGFASPTLTLTYTGSVYSGTFNLTEPVIEASLYLWVNEADPRREIVMDYSLGGNPGNKRSHFGNKRSHFGNKRSHFAPILSSDGQVILYSANLNFAPGEFYAFQAASLIPSPPPWATIVGKGYWLSRSANAPALVGPSISMGYAQNEVPSGEESFLRVYVMTGTTWVALPTTLDPDNNLAVAPAQGPGLYALMSTIEIPLHGPGWDSFAYPVQGTRPITQALQSISGTFAIVYWYDWSAAADPWKVYNVSVPTWVNDLDVLRFGETYLISLTQAITLQLKGASALASVNNASNLVPPATYYGAVLASEELTPTAGMTVTAWINGIQCGQGRTLDVNGQIKYTINVFADGPGAAGCGAPGRKVTLKIGTLAVSPTAIWDNNRLWQVSLATKYCVYLPMIVKSQ